MQIHEIIKKLRKTARVIQDDLAKVLKLGRSSYSQKENGHISFSANELFSVLYFLKQYVSEDEYLNAVTELLSSQSNPTENTTSTIPLPSPVDSAIEILRKFLQEEKKEVVMEKTGPLIQLIRETLAQKEHTGNEAHTLLTKLEKLSIKEFYRIFGDIKETVTGLEQKQVEQNTSREI